MLIRISLQQTLQYDARTLHRTKTQPLFLPFPFSSYLSFVSTAFPESTSPEEQFLISGFAFLVSLSQKLPKAPKSRLQQASRAPGAYTAVKSAREDILIYKTSPDPDQSSRIDYVTNQGYLRNWAQRFLKPNQLMLAVPQKKNSSKPCKV